MVACASASRRRGLGLGTQLMLTSSCAVSFIKLILRWRGVDFVFKPFDTCCLCTFFERLRVSPGGRTLRVDERQDKRLSPGFGARHSTGSFFCFSEAPGVEVVVAVATKKTAGVTPPASSDCCVPLVRSGTFKPVRTYGAYALPSVERFPRTFRA